MGGTPPPPPQAQGGTPPPPPQAQVVQRSNSKCHFSFDEPVRIGKKDYKLCHTIMFPGFHLKVSSRTNLLSI
jgi:hypothetical protein